MPEIPVIDIHVGILIIAESGHNRDSLQAILTSYYPIKGVYNTDNLQIAQAIIKEKKPTLIILDLAIPLSDIQDEIMAIKHLSPQAKCIVVADINTYTQLFQTHNADCILLRGFKTEELFQNIDNLLFSESRYKKVLAQEETNSNPDHYEKNKKSVTFM